MNTAVSPLPQPPRALTWGDWAGSAGLHLLLLAAGMWLAAQSPLADVLYQKLELPMTWVEQPPAPQATPEPPAPAPQPPQVQPHSTTKPPPVAPQPRKVAPPTPAPALRQPLATQSADTVVPTVEQPAAAPAAPAPAAAPAEKSAGKPAAVSADWRVTLDAMLRKHKRYPMSARRMRQQGTVLVQAAFSAGGEVVSCNVAESSGFDALDDAAMQLVRAAAAAANAQGAPGRSLSLRIPVVYELKDT